MGWRSRFDPSKFGIDPKGGWRAAGTRARQVGLRGEVIVPVVAIVLLAVALGLSALSSRSPGDASASPSAGASLSPGASVVAVVPGGSYPAPDETTEPSSGDVLPGEGVTIVPPIDETAVALASPDASAPAGDGPDAAYPGPSDGPVGEGLPDGAVPSPFELAPTPDDQSSDPFPTPEYLDQTPLPEQPVPTFESQPVPTADNQPVPTFDSSYPPPAEDQPTSTPENGELPPGEPPGGDATIVPAPTNESGTPLETPIVDETPIVEETPLSGETATPTPTSVPPTPTARPAEVIAGDTRWTTANSPVTIERDVAVPAGSTLTVDPGVEVRFAPDVRMTIVGTLRASGARFVGSNGRWQGLVGAPGSTIALDGVEMLQAGSGGLAISSTEGSLALSNSRIGDSGGGIYATGSKVELRNNTVVGNNIKGPAVNLRLPVSGQTVVAGNTFAGNGTPPGSQQLLIAAGEAAGPLSIEGNLFSATGEGIGATITTETPLAGAIRCNAFSGGTIGLQIQTNRPDASGFSWTIDSNAYSDQATFGVTGSVGFNFSNNWWNDPSGPADASRNPQGRGVAVGLHQQFQPWLPARPDCAPN